MNLYRLCIFLLISLVIIEVYADNGGDNECNCESKLSLRTKAGVKAATAGLVGALGTTTALGSTTVGFTALGIAKGSIAALIQAKLGTFGAFSLLQSLGATGGLTLLGPVGIGVGALIGTAAYWYASRNDATQQGCNCGDSEPITEEDLEQLFALKAIESCVEPGTSKESVCSQRGICEINKDDEEFYCECQPGFGGTYCEVFKNDTSGFANDAPPSSFTRCNDEFIHNCTQCLIRKFTLNNPKNCYQQCNWENRKSPLIRIDDGENENKDNIRPDVGSLEMKRVVKLNVMEGTQCSVQVNASCATIIKYVYEHSDDYLDQLVVYYSSDEATCDSTFAFTFDAIYLILGMYIAALLAWMTWKCASKAFASTAGFDTKKSL